MGKIPRVLSVLLIEIAKPAFVPARLRNQMLRMAGVRLPKSAIISSNVDIKYVNLRLGEHVLINRNCHLYMNGWDCESDWINIGENTRLAFDVRITTATHLIGAKNERSGQDISKPVNIGKGCWIGMGAVILPGVSIGDGCVIGGGQSL